LALQPERMRIRSQTVEHPFGTLKHWMRATHFQMTQLEHVSTEMSLHVLAYDIKRVINIIGIIALLEAIEALIVLCLALLAANRVIKRFQMTLESTKHDYASNHTRLQA
jgi:hypothetical protein